MKRGGGSDMEWCTWCDGDCYFYTVYKKITHSILDGVWCGTKPYFPLIGSFMLVKHILSSFGFNTILSSDGWEDTNHIVLSWGGIQNHIVLSWGGVPNHIVLSWGGVQNHILLSWAGVQNHIALSWGVVQNHIIPLLEVQLYPHAEGTKPYLMMYMSLIVYLSITHVFAVCMFYGHLPTSHKISMLHILGKTMVMNYISVALLWLKVMPVKQLASLRQMVWEAISPWC